ncbi:hypothetical protein V1511DRAFT_486902 [Dipodascopsis uninucleata]
MSDDLEDTHRDDSNSSSIVQVEGDDSAKKLSKRKRKASSFRDAVKKGEKYVKPSKEPKSPKEARVSKRQAPREDENVADRVDSNASNGKSNDRTIAEGSQLTAGDTKEQPPKKKQKTKDLSESDQQQTESKPKDVRFIVFVGNLPYNTTLDTLKEHLAPSKPDLVRLPTVKPVNSASVSKARGFAFVEFVGPDARRRMNACLNLHHTEFQGRKINVELTVGGGGSKSSKRREKIKEKNRKLEEERQSKRTAKAETESNAGSRHVAAVTTTDSSTTNDSTFVHPSRVARLGNK